MRDGGRGGHHAVAGLFGTFFAVLLVGDFHVVRMLDHLDDFGAHLDLVAELVGDGLGQGRRAAHDVAGEAGLLVPYQQEVTDAGGDLFGVTGGAGDGRAEESIGFRRQGAGEFRECLVGHEVVDALLAHTVILTLAGLVDLAVGFDRTHDLQAGLPSGYPRRWAA